MYGPRAAQSQACRVTLMERHTKARTSAATAAEASNIIRAEVYNCEDLFKYGSEQKVKEAGKLRLEGKDYVVQDGDIMHFRFNV